MSLVFKFRGKILIPVFIERYDWSMIAAIIEFYYRNSIYVHIIAPIIVAAVLIT